jgi:predicted metalloprotease
MLRGRVCRTNDAMRFHCGRRRIFVAPVLEQRPYVALVVDLDGLLRRGRLVARRRRLQDQAVDGSQNEQLTHEIGHLHGSDTSLRVRRASASLAA